MLATSNFSSLYYKLIDAHLFCIFFLDALLNLAFAFNFQIPPLYYKLIKHTSLKDLNIVIL